MQSSERTSLLHSECAKEGPKKQEHSREHSTQKLMTSILFFWSLSSQTIYIYIYHTFSPHKQKLPTLPICILMLSHEHSSLQENIEADNTERKQTKMYIHIFTNIYFFFSSHPDFTQHCHTYFSVSCGGKTTLQRDFLVCSVCFFHFPYEYVYIYIIYIYFMCQLHKQKWGEGGTKILQKRATFTSHKNCTVEKYYCWGCCHSPYLPHQCCSEQTPEKGGREKEKTGRRNS